MEKRDFYLVKVGSKNVFQHLCRSVGFEVPFVMTGGKVEIAPDKVDPYIYLIAWLVPEKVDILKEEVTRLDLECWFFLVTLGRYDPDGKIRQMLRQV